MATVSWETLEQYVINEAHDLGIDKDKAIELAARMHTARLLRVEAQCPGFDQFWKAYPNKNGKKDAERAWRGVCPPAALLAKILAAVTVQAQSEAWHKQGGMFVPLPATWLRGERWNDEVRQEREGEAVKAWNEVRSAVQRGQRPAVWSYVRTADALAAVGGFGALADMRTADAPHRQREFVSAYTSV